MIVVYLVFLVFLVFLVKNLKQEQPDKPNRPERLFFFLTMLVIACSQDYNARLPEYIKAEKELRSRVTPEQGLQDSLIQLAKKFNINPEKETAGLKNRPSAWLSLIDDILSRNPKDKNTGKHEKK